MNQPTRTFVFLACSLVISCGENARNGGDPWYLCSPMLCFSQLRSHPDCPSRQPAAGTACEPPHGPGSGKSCYYCPEPNWGRVNYTEQEVELASLICRERAYQQAVGPIHYEDLHEHCLDATEMDEFDASNISGLEDDATDVGEDCRPEMVPISPLRDSNGGDFAVSVAWGRDGFLVGTHLDPGMHGVSVTDITAMLLDDQGRVTGDPIEVGGTGSGPLVVWGTDTFLVGWTAESDGGRWAGIGGRFLDATGAVLGENFSIVAGTDGDWLVSLSYASGRFFALYETVTETRDSAYLAGRLIDETGDVSEELELAGSCNAHATSDGERFLVAWHDDGKSPEIVGRFVDPAGTIGPTFDIGGVAVPGFVYEISLGFGDSKYLVVWTQFVEPLDDEDSPDFDLYAQVLTESGDPFASLVPVSRPVPLSLGPGWPRGPRSAWDGDKFLVTWTEQTDSRCRDDDPFTCYDVFGAYVSPDGRLVGCSFPIANELGDEAGAPMARGSAGTLVLWGERDHENPETVHDWDMVGAMIPP